MDGCTVRCGALLLQPSFFGAHKKVSFLDICVFWLVYCRD